MLYPRKIVIHNTKESFIGKKHPCRCGAAIGKSICGGRPIEYRDRIVLVDFNGRRNGRSKGYVLESCVDTFNGWRSSGLSDDQIVNKAEQNSSAQQAAGIERACKEAFQKTKKKDPYQEYNQKMIDQGMGHLVEVNALTPEKGTVMENIGDMMETLCPDAPGSIGSKYFNW